MTAPVPETKANAVITEVKTILVAATGFLSPDDMRIRRLLREAEASVKVHPAAGHCAMACVYQLIGDVEQSKYHIDNAVRLSQDPLLIANRSSIMANLGLASEGQQSFNFAVQPKNGWMTFVWNHGYVIGAYRAMKSAIGPAKKLELDLSGLDITTAERAAAILEKFDLSDSDVAPLFDVAGEILRKHRLFYAGTAPRTDVWDGEERTPFIRVTFKVAAPSDTAHSMYLELVEGILQKSLKAHTAVSVEFEGASASDERKAA